MGAVIGSKDVIDLCRVLRHTFAIQGCPEETECIRVFSIGLTPSNAIHPVMQSLSDFGA